MNNASKIVVGIVVLALLYGVYYWFFSSTISIVSDPSGAVVRVDGRVRGQTPITYLAVDGGKHHISVSHSHFAAFEESIVFTGGDHLNRDIKMQAGRGTFEFLSNPKGAWVEINGVRQAGVTPITSEVSSGVHSIRMGQAERRTVEKDIELKAGVTLPVNFNLNMDPHGSLSLVVQPAKAHIEFVDNKLEYTRNMRLPMGDYAIEISHPGYLSQTQRFTVGYGENIHRVNLQREFGVLSVDTTPADADVRILYREGAKQRQKTYTRGLRVPIGQFEAQVAAIGYRSQTRRLNMVAKGVKLRVDLQRMNVEPGKAFKDDLLIGGHSPVMVVIPGGSFQMGNAQGPPSERPVHKVSLAQPFAVSKFEITVGDFMAYAIATDKSLHERVDTSAPNHAMAYVSFKEAEDYATWLSSQTGQIYRLLTESEWEYVARAGTTTAYYFGDDPQQLCLHANVADQATKKIYRDWDTMDCNDGEVRPGPVGAYLPNAFGLHDVYGNVAEWVLDCGMPDYPDGPTDGQMAREGENCGSHGIRGGSWDSMAVETTSSYRNTAASANDDRGIRLLRIM